VVFDDGQMAMRVQFKVEPNPPTVGRLTLMARVKNNVGYPMPVGHVYFAISKDGQSVLETLEGDPVGNFQASGNGYYTVTAELQSPGSYQVNLQVEHQQSRFDSNWPLEVQQR